MVMIGWIGLIAGLALLAAGAFVLLGLVRLLSEGKPAAFIAGVIAAGLLGVMLLFGLLFLGSPMQAEFTPMPVHDGGGRWVTESHSHGEFVIQPPRQAAPPVQVAPQTLKDSIPTLPASHVQAEVTKFEPNDPLTTAPASVPTAEVAPGTKVPEPIAGPRPDWLERKPEWIEGNYRVVVVSGLFPTEIDAGNDLSDRARRELANYYSKEYGATGELTPDAELNHLVNAQVLRDRYNEPVQSDILETTMYRQHGLLVISPELRGKLESIWRKQLVDRRLTHTGQTAGGVLAMLGLLWGVLKITARRQKPVVA